METIPIQVLQSFGEAQPHHACLFANRHGNRLKVLVHDGYGVWPAKHRLNQGRFKLMLHHLPSSVTKKARGWLCVLPSCQSWPAE